MFKRFFCLVVPVGLLMANGCQTPAPPDYSSELRPIIDAYVEAWNTGQVDGLNTVIADSIRRHAPSGLNASANNFEELKAVIGGFRTAFPDGRVTIDEALFLENRSIVNWTYTGTNSGEGEFPATGKRVSVSGVSIGSYEGGKLVQEWVYTDSLDMMTQLGFTLTPPAQEESEEQK